MHRAAFVSLVVVLVIAGCGNTPAEDAFLAELQDRGSVIKIENLSRQIQIGHAACDELSNTKLADRDLTRYLLSKQSPFTRLNVDAALHHLCPELGLNPP